MANGTTDIFKNIDIDKLLDRLVSGLQDRGFDGSAKSPDSNTTETNTQAIVPTNESEESRLYRVAARLNAPELYSPQELAEASAADDQLYDMRYLRPGMGTDRFGRTPGERRIQSRKRLEGALRDRENRLKGAKTEASRKRERDLNREARIRDIEERRNVQEEIRIERGEMGPKPLTQETGVGKDFEVNEELNKIITGGKDVMAESSARAELINKMQDEGLSSEEIGDKIAEIESSKNEKDNKKFQRILGLEALNAARQIEMQRLEQLSLQNAAKSAQARAKRRLDLEQQNTQKDLDNNIAGFDVGTFFSSLGENALKEATDPFNLLYLLPGAGPLLAAQRGFKTARAIKGLLPTSRTLAKTGRGKNPTTINLSPKDYQKVLRDAKLTLGTMTVDKGSKAAGLQGNPFADPTLTQQQLRK